MRMGTFEYDRVVLLQHLRVSDAGVCHVSVDAPSALPGGSSPRPSRHCLVVAETTVAEGHIVHAA